MKVKFFPLVFLVLVFIQSSIPGFAQIGYSTKIDSLINLITSQSVSILDRQLSGDTSCVIGGLPYTIVSRYYGSASNQKASQFIFETLQSYGYTPRYQNNSSTDINVIAVKTGTKYPNQYFVICSHYDDMPSGTTAPGADDNGSGTVGVLEAARILKNFPTEYSIIFATFDEEERGLYGSQAFADSSYIRGDSIVCAINLDMIGYDGNNDGKSWIVTNAPSEGFANDYISAMRTYLPTLLPEKHIDLTANSDHASFWTRNYKAFMNIEDENDFTPYYHTVNDKFNTLNIPFFRGIIRTAIAALTSFSKDMRMDFYHTPLSNGNFVTARTATVVIKSKNKVATGTSAPKLYYKVNGGTFSSVNYNYTNLDTFKFTIPGNPLGSVVSYYFAAQDSAGNYVCTYPAGGRGMNPPGTQAPATVFSYTVENVNYACVGNGTTSIQYPFYSYWMDSKTDMLFLNSELGLSGPKILTRIGFNIDSASPQSLNNFTIKLQNTLLTSLTGFEQSNWTTVYSVSQYTVPGNGWRYIDFTIPFYYDGVNNLLAEICFDNNAWTTSTTVYSTAVSGMTWAQYQDNSAGCEFTGGSAMANRPNVCFVFQQGTLVGNNGSLLPSKYELNQNYPNPFNPVTKINFALPKRAYVSLKIYNTLGKEVAVLVSETKAAGYYTIDFNGSDLSSGVYYYRLESEGFMDVKKMILVK